MKSRLSKHKCEGNHFFTADPIKSPSVPHKQRMFTYKTAETGHMGLMKLTENSVEQVDTQPMDFAMTYVSDG